MKIIVTSSKAVFFTQLGLGFGFLGLCYYFLSAIVFFGFFITLDLLAIFYIVKMNISEEAQRLGRNGNAILGFMGMLAVQIVLLRNSNFVSADDVNLYVVEAGRKGLQGYSVLIIGASLILFVITYNIVRKVMEEYPVDPPPGLLYAFTTTSSLGSALLMYGSFFWYDAIYVDMSTNFFLEIRVKEAGIWLVLALFLMYFLMARLKFKSGDKATVYFLGKSIYSLTGHRDLMVPVASAVLHFITELAEQHPIGFSADFLVIRRELPRQESYEIVLSSPGEQKPVRLDGRGSSGDHRLPALPAPKTSKGLDGGGSVLPSPESTGNRGTSPTPSTLSLQPKEEKKSAVSPPTEASLRSRIVRRGDELKPKENKVVPEQVPEPESQQPTQAVPEEVLDPLDPEVMTRDLLLRLTQGSPKSGNKSGRSSR